MIKMTKKILFIFVILSLIPLVFAGQNFTTTSYKVEQLEYGTSAGENLTPSYYFDYMFSSQAQNSSTKNYTFYLTTFTGQNLAPKNVTLYEPSDANVTTLLNPTLVWNNSLDPDNDTLIYHLLLDDDSDFTSPIIDTTIGETEPRTSYLVTDDLAVDKTYYWKVRAFDGSAYSLFSEARNFTINSLIIVSLPNNAINFGDLGIGDKQNTTTGILSPILIQNDGNIPVNITITGDDLWIAQKNPSVYYQFKVIENETKSYYSATSNYTAVNQTRNITDIVALNYSDISDSAELHLKIEVPPLEDEGAKSSSLTVNAE